VTRCEAGQGWTWDDVRFTVLHPTAAHYARAGLKPNDLSCVVRIESQHGSVLLTGDLEGAGRAGARAARFRGAQGRRAARPASRQPNVVDAGVHRAVAPDIASIPRLSEIGSGHPRPVVVCALRSRRIRSYRTDLEMARHVPRSDPISHTPAGRPRDDHRYWYDAPLRAENEGLPN
jgi:competence protein ComEC